MSKRGIDELREEQLEAAARMLLAWRKRRLDQERRRQGEQLDSERTKTA